MERAENQENAELQENNSDQSFMCNNSHLFQKLAKILLFIQNTTSALKRGFDYRSPPTCIVVVECHSQYNIVRKGSKVLHQYVQFTDQQNTGFLNIFTVCHSFEARVTAIIT